MASVVPFAPFAPELRADLQVVQAGQFAIEAPDVGRWADSRTGGLGYGLGGRFIYIVHAVLVARAKIYCKQIISGGEFMWITRLLGDSTAMHRG
jgi:hypothetical protein